MPDDQGEYPYDEFELERLTKAMTRARAENGFRFDAINRQHDARDSFNDEIGKRAAVVNASRVSELHAALAEFLRRMNSVDYGRPNETFRVGLLKKVRGWIISYGDPDQLRYLPLTVDGRTNIVHPRQWVSFEEWQPDLTDRQLETFMRNLASMLRSQGMS